MSSVTLYRASGLALLLGFLLAVSGFVLRVLVVPGIPTPTQLASALFVGLQVLIFSGLALLLFGGFAIVARLAELTGWLGLAGALLLFLSGVVIVRITAVNWLATPWLAVHAPANVATQVAFGTPAAGVAALVAGWLILGGGVLAEMAMMRARLLSPWAGLLIIVGAVLGLVWDFAIHSYLVGFVILVGAILLVVLGLGWMAYALLIAKGEVPQQPAPTP